MMQEIVGVTAIHSAVRKKLVLVCILDIYMRKRYQKSWDLTAVLIEVGQGLLALDLTNL